MINTDYPNELRAALTSAVQMSFADCSDHHERYIAGNCIIEFLSALSLEDEEIIAVLQDASGDSLDVDIYIDQMIANIKE